jgi:hypothetical protein
MFNAVIVALWLVGSIGLTLGFLSFPVVKGASKWFMSFMHPMNPLWMFGKLLSCELCAGFWIGGLLFPEVLVRELTPHFGWMQTRLFAGGLCALFCYAVGVRLAIEELKLKEKEDEHSYVEKMMKEKLRKVDEGPSEPDARETEHSESEAKETEHVEE